MYIDFISVKNFKGIKNSDVYFTESVSQIKGDNESGKSSILDAISVIRDIVVLGWSPVYWQPNFYCDENEPTTIEIGYSTNNEYRFGITYTKEGLTSEWFEINGFEVYIHRPDLPYIKTLISAIPEIDAVILRKLFTDQILYINDKTFDLTVPIIYDFSVYGTKPRDVFSRMRNEIFRTVGISNIDYEMDRDMVCTHRVADGVEKQILYKYESTSTKQKLCLMYILDIIRRYNGMVVLVDDLDSNIDRKWLETYIETIKKEDVNFIFTSPNEYPVETLTIK